MIPTLEQLGIWCILAGAAFLAGAINTMAGGGTLLTFPALQVFGGLTAVQANGTSTVALVPGSIAGAWGYRRELGESVRWVKLLLIPSIIGGAIGTLLVTRLPDAYFRFLVPWLLLSASLLFMAQPMLAKRFPPHPETGQPSWRIVSAVVFFQFVVALYGGYFGAGIGILMLSSLGLMGLGDIHRMNAVKTILAAAINGTSVIVWIIEGRVVWHLVGIMMVGAILGGYAGAVVGRRLPRWLVRWFVIAIGLGLSVYYFVK